MKVLKVTKLLSLDNFSNQTLLRDLINGYAENGWNCYLHKKNNLYEFVTDYPVPGCGDFKRHEVDRNDLVESELALKLINGNNNNNGSK